ncbi:hypothetical protein N9M75_02150 [Schleiferiaceae bacterium]|nr:hypothetical protein [Schleiferiaceae bacterium]
MSHSYKIFNRLKKMPSKVETIVKVLFVLLTVQYVISYYAGEAGIFPRYVLYIFFTFPIINLVLIYFNTRVKWSMYRFVFIAYFFLIASNSVIQAQGEVGEIVANFIMYSAILAAFYFSFIGVSFLFDVFKLVALVGIVGFVYIMGTESIDLESAIRRGYTWTEMFYYASLYWAVIPAVILSFLYERKILIVVLYWIFAIILNLIFLKRFILVDSILLLLVVLFINFNKDKKLISGFKLYFIMASLVGLSLYFASEFIVTLFDATNERMEFTTDDVSGFDRFVEYRNYFEKEATIIDFFIGKGFSSFHKGLGKQAYSLHTGWANFIFKGGVIWLILILIPFFKMILLIGKFKKLPVDIQFSVALLLIYVPRLFYTNMDNFQPIMLVFFYALFKVADYKNSKPTLPIV